MANRKTARTRKNNSTVAEKSSKKSNEKKPTKVKPRSHKRSNTSRSDAQNTNVQNQSKRIKLQSLQVQGHLLTCGQGDIGQLGQGEDVFEKSRPGLVLFEDDDIADIIVDVAAGGMHSICLTSDGHVYSFGCNDEGALGRITEGKEGAEFKAERVDLPASVVQISAGDSHSAALSEDGVVYIWGMFRDSSGAMGLVTPGKAESSPVVLVDHVQVVKIQSGNNHLVCLTKDGEIFTCGCAEQGQLGRVAEYFSNRGGRKGLEWILTPRDIHFKKVGGKKPQFDDVWAGSYTTYAKAKGTKEIVACGLNNYLQLGLKDMHCRFQPEPVHAFMGTDVKMIGGGQHHTLAVDMQGHVYALGRKEYGRLGLGENCEDAMVPTLIKSLKGKKCCQLSCGISVSFAADLEGNVYSWGMGSNSQLGHGNDDDKFVPSQITSKGMLARNVIKVTSGGQHTMFLAYKKEAEN